MSTVRIPRCLLSDFVLLFMSENTCQGFFTRQICLKAEQLPKSKDTNISFIDRASR